MQARARTFARQRGTSTEMAGQSELGGQNPAPGGSGPRAPNGRNGPLRGSEAAKVGNPHSA
eukprot:7709899-Alexandrium_andersonii.AAC.1